MEHVPPLAEFFLIFSQQACTGLPLTRGKAMPVGWGTEMKKHILYHSLSEGADTTNLMIMESRRFQMDLGNSEWDVVVSFLK